jgi:hypothetical protein
MEIQITLSNTDKEYASRHGLSDSDMRDFILDMRLADELERRSICEAEQRRAAIMSTPQYQVYDAW